MRSVRAVLSAVFAFSLSAGCTADPPPREELGSAVQAACEIGGCGTCFECAGTRCVRLIEAPACCTSSSECGTGNGCVDDTCKCTSTACPSPQVCTDETTCCTPEPLSTTCAGAACGTRTNNCGQVVACANTCAAGVGCNANACACTTDSCVAPKVCTNTTTCCTPESAATTCGGHECGIRINNCGQDVSCGQCASPLTCGGGGVQGKCDCTPRTCAMFACGVHPNGCNGPDLNCGPCDAGTQDADAPDASDGGDAQPAADAAMDTNVAADAATPDTHAPTDTQSATDTNVADATGGDDASAEDGAVAADTGPVDDAASADGGELFTRDTTGCGCQTPRSSGAAPLGLFLGFALVARRRRR